MVFELMAKLGLDTSEYENGLKGAESKASNFGKALASGVGTAAKVATAATAAAATAVGAMTKQAVDGFADYEQLAGGVETLFGSSAQKVLQDSEAAFKSAGMSQNQYLETSIQSAASLINSLGGDQAKAADLMNVSIVDMADNVNKMGTSMEGVQNAYRGFSRGNFMMLDNLALGFAGTKEGMQELLDKAKELSGVEYNIDSYADIVQAIHVVQEEMGIAGTTAKEGTETISGSLAQLGSAWQNLVAGLANPDADLGALIDNVVSSAETALTNLLPAIENALGGIANLIEKIAPIIADKLPGLIDTILPPLLNAATDLLTGVASALPGIISTVFTAAPDIIAALMQAGFDLILELANGMTEPGAMESFMNAILNIIESIAMWIAEYANVLIEAGVKMVTTLLEGLTNPDSIGRIVDIAVLLITSLLDGIINAIPTLLQAAPMIIMNLIQAIVENVPKLLQAAVEIIQGLVSGMSENLPKIVQAGVEILIALIAGLIQALPNVISTSLQIIGAIKDAFANVNWLELGVNIIKGIIAGIANGVGALVDAVKSAAKKALDGAKNFLGIKSPSRVFRDSVGKMIDMGLAEGIEGNTGYVDNAMNDLNDATAIDFSQPQFQLAGGYGIINSGSSVASSSDYGDVITAITDALMSMQLMVKIGERPIEAIITSAQQRTIYRSGGR